MNDLFVLHLSDLHFGDKNIKTQDNLHKALLKDITDNLNSVEDKRIVIIITGDTLTRGDNEVLDQATNFFEELANSIGDKVAGLFITPGNHDKFRTDVNKVLIPSFRAYMDSLVSYPMFLDIKDNKEEVKAGFGKEFEASLWDIEKGAFDIASYDKLVDKIYDLFPNDEIKKTAQNTFGVNVLEVAGKQYSFIQLNTAWSCIGKNDYRHLILGDFQIDQIEAQYKSLIKPYEDDISYSFMLAHHPLEFLYGTEQDKLMSHITSFEGIKVDCYLCGHTHEVDMIDWMKNDSIYIKTLMAGIGWSEKATSTKVKKHSYSIYCINHDLNSMDIRVRETNEHGKFVTKDDSYSSVSAFSKPLKATTFNNLVTFTSAKDSVEKHMFVDEKFYSLQRNVIDTMDIVSRRVYFQLEKDKRSFLRQARDLILIDKEKSLSEDENALLSYLSQYMDDRTIHPCEKTPSKYNGKLAELFSRSVLKDKANTIFKSFLQFLCNLITEELMNSEIIEGSRYRFHIRYLTNKERQLYSVLAFSFAPNDEEDNTPSEIEYCDLIKAIAERDETRSGSMIYSINKEICSNKLKDKWNDFITIIPRLEISNYASFRKGKKVTYIPYITAGMTIGDDKITKVLYAMNSIPIDEIIGEYIDSYLRVFRINISELF